MCAWCDRLTSGCALARIVYKWRSVGSSEAIARRMPDQVVAIAGDYVKVERNNERFWVMVTSVTPKGIIHGCVDNHLRQNPDLKYGDPIAIHATEVLETARDSDLASIHRRTEQLQGVGSIHDCRPIGRYEAAQRAALEWWDKRLGANTSAPARPTAAYFLQHMVEPRSVPEALLNVTRVLRG